MSLTKSGTLRVPGANIYYEVLGKGPLLLLIHGAGGDAGAFSGIAKHLADQYTVVTYDRRGLSRSILDDPEAEQQVEVHSDDAHRLLEELSINSAAAYVFGSSGGATIGLDLVARHPQQVHTLVAHEPPSKLLVGLEDRHDNIRDTYRREGANAALQQFIAQIGVTYDDREPDAELPERGERARGNAKFLMEHEFAMYDHYQFDFAALGSASHRSRIIIAGGQSGRESIGYRNAAAMAEQLGTAIVDFPSHHVGYVSHPRAFAAKLLDVLSNEQDK